MKATVMTTTEIEISFIEMELPIRHGEEDMPHNFPFRDRDLWKPKVCIDSGQIQGWPVGKTGDIHMKVCDQGVYRLLNHAGEEVATLESEYVPHGVVPGEYGDYIIVTIDEAGYIPEWPKSPDVSEFFPNNADA